MFWRKPAIRLNAAWMVAGMVVGAIALSCGNDANGPGDTPSDEPPAFRTGPASSVPSPVERTTIQLTASANDPEGAAITYAWSQVTPATPTGTFSAATSANTNWKAPKVTAATPFKLRLKISDGKNEVTGDVDITVTDDGQPNAAPAFGVISVASAAVAGDQVDLVASATDADGDALTFSWSQTLPSSQGVFADASKAIASWRSPSIASNTAFTIQVNVTDGEATTTQTRAINVAVPSFANDIQDIFTNNCSGCHPTEAGLNLTLGNARAGLVGVAASASTGCGATVRVVAGSPDTSILVKRIEGTCEERMPQSNPTFFDQNPGLVTKIRSWILNGALNN